MSKSKTSLISFINRRITIVYLIILFISAPLIYNISITQMENETVIELSSMIDTIKNVSPKLLSTEFDEGSNNLPVIARLLLSHENYFYRFVDVNNPQKNGIFSQDNGMLANQFMANPDLESISGKVTDGRMDLVYEAFPVKSFGLVNGFIIFGIERDLFSKTIIVRVATFIGLMTIFYAIFISSINTALRNHVINPLIRMNNRTKAVANGEINKVFKSDRKDEIGELIKSIELLRRSLSISMSLYEDKPKKSA